jgi:glycosyltransferase involved in cell wall biosynthesis
MSLHDYSLICANKRLMRGDEPCSGPSLGKCLRCASNQYGIAKGPATALALSVRSRAVRTAVDHFLPVSTSVATRSRLGMGDTPFDVLPNFMSDDDFAYADAPDTEDRDTGLPDTEFLLFFGDATHDKGIDVLLRAHRALGHQPALVVMGRPLASSLRVPPPNVHVVGTRPHRAVLRAARRATIAIVPSLWAEPFGLVALEAMAMGTPVVAARSGGLEDVLIDGETGLLTPPGDSEALAVALRRVLDDAELRKRMASAARQRAERFREEPVISELERIYRGTIESTRPASMTQGTAG